MPNAKTASRFVIAVAIALCLAGFFLRLFFYGINRSLAFDEALLALNLVNRSFLELLKPLDFNQGAPIGFLLLLKVAIRLLGSRDYILRLVPLLAGLVSIPLMYAVSKRYSRHISVFISLGLLALSPRLIYYSSELKQYSGDVAVALLLLLVVPNCLENTPKPRAFVALGIAGSLAIWLSYPSLFVLAAIGLTLGVAFAIQRDIYRLSWLIGIGAVWAANLALTYVVNLRYLESNDNLTNYWIGTFAPLPPWSNLGWYSNAFIDMLNDPATLPISAITTGIVFLGVVSFAFRRWALMLVLLIPFLLTLIASALGKYPFSGRLLLFLMPLLLLLLAEGAELFQKVLLRVNRPMAGLAYASLVVYLLYGPVDAAYKNVQSPPLVEHIKATMSYMSKRYLRTDVIYVYYGARPAFEFYAPLYGFESADYIIGSSSRKDPSKYIADIEQLEGKRRVWFIFTHNCSFCTVNEQNFILKHLNKIGSKKDEYISDGTAVYLYDLGQSP